MNNRLRDYLESGHSLVTANNRLARFLSHQYAEHQLKNNITAWETPKILPWQSWLKEYWEEQQFAKQDALKLLSNNQQRCLWQQVIQSSSSAKQLLQVNSVVPLAIRSYELCKSWCLPIFPDGHYLNDDVGVFKSWALEYERQLEHRHWIDYANLPDYFCLQSLPDDYRDSGIAFYGFDDYTPQQQRLTDYLDENGCDVDDIKPENVNRSARYVAFNDSSDEIKSAARWAGNVLEEQPSAKIGIVIPELKSRRQEIVSAFDEILDPESLVRFHNTTRKPYVISIGRNLNEYPLIHTALQILSLGRRKHTLNELGALIRSPNIKGGESEHAARAKLDVVLRETRQYEWSIKTVYRIAEQGVDQTQRPVGIVDLLKEFELKFLSCPRNQTLLKWAKSFDEWLKSFGWPGERTLDSSEFQLVVEWKKALSEMALLDNVLPVCTYQSALSHLTRVLGEISFQPETAEAPVQILGTSGAAAMQFDYLWVLGVHDQVMPGLVQPDPFIPLTLQREYAMPHSTAEIQFNRSQKLADNLAQSSGDVIVSYPCIDGDRECRPSPIFKSYLADKSDLIIDDHPNYLSVIHSSLAIETYKDFIAPAISDSETASGGTALFRDQAACPFRSFARHRLYAEGMAENDIGLAPAERGLILHRAMHYLWQRIKSSDYLHDHAGAEIDKLIQTVVTKTLQQQSLQQPETFTQRFTELETQRLVGLIRNWLVVELGRTPFKVVETEGKHRTIINNLKCNMRIDRIDELADGRQVILDYKTGKVNPADWEGDRPEDLQLPLYAVSKDKNIAAIAYAQIKRGETKFAGLAVTDGILPDVKPAVDCDTGVSTWSDTMQNWETVLARLASDFRQGRAEVDPKNSETCRYCDLHSLCRIHELASIEPEQINEEQ